MSEQTVKKCREEMRHALEDFLTADKRIKSIYNAYLRRRRGNVQYATLDLTKNGEFVNVLRGERTDAQQRVVMYAQIIQAELAITSCTAIAASALDVTGV